MKFYKITNKSECHNGMKYQTGLNIDILPFNPSGDCEPGGIYFSREDILAFLNYGPWIREVIIPEDARVYENPDTPKKWKADKVILCERRRIDIDVIRELIEEGANPKADNSYALQWAANNGHTEIVKILIPVSDPKACDSYALQLAATNGHTEIVKILIPVSDPKARDSYALQWAAEYGHIDIVKLLIPVSDEEVVNSELVQNLLKSMS